MRLTKIVTRNGDKGMTSFGGGCSLISKGHPAIELIGGIDELNAHIGLIKAYLKGSMHEDLEVIQNKLFDMGGEVFMNKDDRIRVLKEDVEVLETLIEALNARLPVLKEFILPGADIVSAYIHVARTVCRRVEIHAVRYFEAHKSSYPEYLRYLNRLSDFLFVLARAAGMREGTQEAQWKRK